MGKKKKKRAKVRPLKLDSETVQGVKESKGNTKRFVRWMNKHWDEYESWQDLKKGFYKFRQQKEG